MSEPQRLSKLMAQRGLCSRREADRFIEQGLVKVDGKVIDQLGTKVHPDSHIELAQEAKQNQKQLVSVILNKPPGYLSGQKERDKDYKMAVDLVQPKNRWQDDTGPAIPNQMNLAPSGRLDINSSGLIIFTEDGRLAKAVIGKDSQIEKEYLIRVKGSITPQVIDKLKFGLELDGRQLRRAKVFKTADDRLRMVLKEGRKRQIRRMCELVGLEVQSLIRIRVGHLELGDLPQGQWRRLSEAEIQKMIQISK